MADKKEPYRPSGSNKDQGQYQTDWANAARGHLEETYEHTVSTFMKEHTGEGHNVVAIYTDKVFGWNGPRTVMKFFVLRCTQDGVKSPQEISENWIPKDVEREFD